MNYNEDRILDVYQGKNKNGTKILVHNDIQRGNNQCRLFVKCGEYFCIKSLDCYNKVINIPDSENVNKGKELDICDFYGGNNQLWKFAKV